MQYKIIVDKQPRTNPSEEKKEYIVDIEELRMKGSICDELVITKDKDYVIRRLELTEYHVLKILDEPVQQPLKDIDIELFEGENYVYILDMVGNRFYAEYLIKNEFNSMYVTERRLTSAINQLSGEIELNVTQKLDEEMTSANIILKINDNISEAKINADKISFVGKILDFTTNNMSITSDNFSVDKDGNIMAKSGEIGGFKLGETEFSTDIEGLYNFNIYDVRNIIAMQKGLIGKSSIAYKVYDVNGDNEVDLQDGQKIIRIVNGLDENTKNVQGIFKINSKDAKNFLSILCGGSLVVSLGTGGINTQLLSAENIVCSTSSQDIAIALNGTTGEISGKNFNNTSLESTKKNIEKFNSDVLDTVKNAEIYKFNYKIEDDRDKKHIGFVIGENYKTPEEAISNNGQAIDIYSMSSILWKAVQELTAKVEKLEQEVSNEKN